MDTLNLVMGLLPLKLTTWSWVPSHGDLWLEQRSLAMDKDPQTMGLWTWSRGYPQPRCGLLPRYFLEFFYMMYFESCLSHVTYFPSDSI